MANCYQCGIVLKANKSFCTECGAKAAASATALPSTQQAKPQAPASASTSCSNCGASVPEGKQFCTRCGHSLGTVAQSQANLSTGSVVYAGPSKTVAGVKCGQCGAIVTDGKRYCTACGKPIPTKPPQDCLPVNLPGIKAVRGSIKSVKVKPEGKAAQVKPPDVRRLSARQGLLRLGLPIAAALVVAAGLVFIYTQFIRKPALLDDRQLLETYYGPPPFFTVILARDENQPASRLVRREVWVYPDKNVSFVFLGGKYQFSSDLQAARKSASKAANKLRLEQITESLTTDELSKLTGSKPVSENRLPETDLPDAIQYEYGNGVSAVFSQGRLLMARIMPAPEGR
jgi:hypothetical protein